MPIRAFTPDHRRLRAMGFLAAAGFAALLGRTLQLTALRGPAYAAKLDSAKVERVILEPTRGTLRDAHGKVLAESRRAFQVSVLPDKAGDPGAAAARLGDALGLTDPERDRVRAAIAAAREAGRARPILVKRDVAPAAAEDLLRRGPYWARVERRDTRAYPYGALAVHVVGYLNEISRPELDEQRDGAYRAGDRLGRSGAERAFERTLRGVRGYEDRPRTRWARLAPGKAQRLEPAAGSDLALTIDIELMRAIDRAFEIQHQPTGAAVVLEVETGRVLALYSRPTFDPAQGPPPIALGGRHELDRALMAPAAPGATFEAFAGLAGPADPVTCDGAFRLGQVTHPCTGKHGRVDRERALAEGCNTFFFAQAERLGLDALAAAFADFGLDQPTGIGVGREARGSVPGGRGSEPAGPGVALDVAVGQGGAQVTALGLAVAYAALANGGRLLVPQLVLGAPPVARKVVRASNADLARVRAGLRGAVTSERGVARALAEAGVPVAGLVGSAPKRGIDLTDGWFAGYAPAEGPEIAVVVRADDSGAGRAASLAAAVFRAYFEGKVR